MGKEGFSLFWALMKLPDQEHRIERRTLWSQDSLLLWWSIVPFAVIFRSVGDHLQGTLASVSQKQGFSIVIALRPIVFDVQHYDRSADRLLRYNPL